MKIHITQRLLERYPPAKFFCVLAQNFTNHISSPYLEEKKERNYGEIRKINDIKLIRKISEKKSLHESFGKSYPIELQVSSIMGGKKIPTESVLRDVLFVSEM